MITRFYPSGWRRRYGQEFCAMLELGPGDVRTVANGIEAAVREHIVPTQGGGMNEQISFGSMMKRPSAYVPVAMSAIALITVLAAITAGMHQAGHVVHDRDEDSVAHIWQLLMTVQMPVVLWFVARWLRRAPRQGFGVIALQAGAWLASCAPVYLLHL
jgi:hypothetical protein